METQKSMLTTEDVANYLKVDVVTVRRLISRGELAAYRIGGEFRFTSFDLQDYLGRQYMPAQGHPPPHAEAGTIAPVVEERFTGQARRALALAQETAEELRCARIHTSHLLLALAAQPGGIAAESLRATGVTADQVRLVLASQPELTGPARRAKDAVDIDSGVKRALEAAVVQARKSTRGYIDTEHLLLGLLEDRNGKAVGVLKILQIRPDAVRSKLRESMKQTGT